MFTKKSGTYYRIVNGGVGEGHMRITRTTVGGNNEILLVLANGIIGLSVSLHSGV
jgi:hypothetical protein